MDVKKVIKKFGITFMFIMSSISILDMPWWGR